MKTILLFCCQLIFISSFFSKINANYNDDKVEIYWTQSNNLKTAYFVIERSENGKHFSETMRVQGGGNNVEYYEIDYQPPSKMAYYRIKQVGVNGNYKYSETILVKNYNKLNYYGNIKKTLKGYKGTDILVILRNKKGKEFYLKVDITEYKKELFAMTIEMDLKSETYLIVATEDDVLLNRKVKVIGSQGSTDSFYTQNK
jgi:hypothetical protein